MIGLPSRAVATSADLGKTPPVLLLCRAELLAGKGADYSAKESQIVRAYQDANIPVYWVALRSITGSPHLLYFDGHESFADIEAANASMGKATQSHPEIANLQSDLLQFVQATQTILNVRREDLSYRLDRFDIVKFRYARVTVIQLRSGYEPEFAEALHAARKAFEAAGIDWPWAVFQVHSGMPSPTFVAVQLLNSLKEFDDALDARRYEHENPFEFSRAKSPALAKDAISFMESNLYSVDLSISHIAKEDSSRLLPREPLGGNLYPPARAANPIAGTKMESHTQGRN
jgi:hypothetical protein